MLRSIVVDNVTREAYDGAAQKWVEANPPHKKDKAAGEDRYVAIKKLFLTLLNTSAAREGGWVRSTWPNERSGYRRRRVLVVY